MNPDQLEVVEAVVAGCLPKLEQFQAEAVLAVADIAENPWQDTYAGCSETYASAQIHSLPTVETVLVTALTIVSAFVFLHLDEHRPDLFQVDVDGDSDGEGDNDDDSDDDSEGKGAAAAAVAAAAGRDVTPLPTQPQQQSEQETATPTLKRQALPAAQLGRITWPVTTPPIHLIFRQLENTDGVHAPSPLEGGSAHPISVLLVW